MIEHLDVLAAVIISLGLVKLFPTWWFSREEKIRREAAKRLKRKLR